MISIETKQFKDILLQNTFLNIQASIGMDWSKSDGFYGFQAPRCALKSESLRHALSVLSPCEGPVASILIFSKPSPHFFRAVLIFLKEGSFVFVFRTWIGPLC